MKAATVAAAAAVLLALALPCSQGLGPYSPSDDPAFQDCPPGFQGGNLNKPEVYGNHPAGSWATSLQYVALHMLPNGCQQDSSSLALYTVCTQPVTGCGAPQADGSQTCTSGNKTYLAGEVTQASNCVPATERLGFNATFDTICTTSSQVSWNLTAWDQGWPGLCSSNGGFTPQSFYTSADADIALEVAEENEDNVDCPGGVAETVDGSTLPENIMGNVCVSTADENLHGLQISPSYQCGDGSVVTAQLWATYEMDTESSASCSYSAVTATFFQIGTS